MARQRGQRLDQVDFHCWLAWLTDGQLGAAQRAARDAGMAVGVVHDLAVGVHPSGSDAWALQDALARGMSVGAPPDAFNARGQDWGCRRGARTRSRPRGTRPTATCCAVCCGMRAGCASTM